jgi:hypothetical protein
VPADVDDPEIPKASGWVQLPLHIRWSEPLPVYNLGRRADRIRVYEQVLREGTNEEVRYYILIDELLELFEDLVLPPTVRQAWASWLLHYRGVKVTC